MSLVFRRGRVRLSQSVLVAMPLDSIVNHVDSGQIKVDEEAYRCNNDLRLPGSDEEEWLRGSQHYQMSIESMVIIYREFGDRRGKPVLAGIWGLGSTSLLSRTRKDMEG